METANFTTLKIGLGDSCDYNLPSKLRREIVP